MKTKYDGRYSMKQSQIAHLLYITFCQHYERIFLHCSFSFCFLLLRQNEILWLIFLFVCFFFLSEYNSIFHLFVFFSLRFACLNPIKATRTYTDGSRSQTLAS